MISGRNTIQWMADAREIPASLNKATIASRIGSAVTSGRTTKLEGATPRATDVEVIRNPSVDDYIAGVIRVDARTPVENADLAEVIIDTLRANGIPDAKPHMGAVGESVGSVTGWLLARARDAQAAITGDEWTDEQLAQTLVRIAPGIDNNARPPLSVSTVGALTSAASTRESEDPSRNGSVGTQAARAAADEARNAINAGTQALLPPWLPYAVAGAGALLVVAVAAGIFYRVSGK